MGDLFGGHFFDQFSAPLLDHFWPPEWSQNPPTIDAKLLPHRASKFTSFMAHFCPPLASERERCWAQNLDFSLAFAIYYANRLFSFLVVSASSFAPPWAQFKHTKHPTFHQKMHLNTCRDSSRCPQLCCHVLATCWNPFWLHCGTIFR